MSTIRKIEKRLDHKVKLARPLLAKAAILTLAFDDRCKSRLATSLDNGESVALLMPRRTILAEGDVLVAEDGGLVRVVAAAESVMRVTARTTAELIRAAYHLGNRHTPVELGDGYLQLEYDPVLRDMLLGLGVAVSVLDAPFHPEAGAYGGGHRHGHDATFAEDYALAQKVFADHGDGNGHEHNHGHGHGHDSGPASAHQHDHGHGHEDQHGHGQSDGGGHQHASGNLHEPTARPARTPVRIPVRVPVSNAGSGHVHGPGCGHDHGHGHDKDHGKH